MNATKKELLDQLLETAGVSISDVERENPTLDKNEVEKLLEATRRIKEERDIVKNKLSAERSFNFKDMEDSRKKTKRLIVGLAVSNVFWMLVTIALTKVNG